MKKIEILGTGCAKCKKLYEAASRVCADLGLEVEIEKVEDINRIVDYGVMMTPGIVIDGKVVSSGKALSDDELTRLFSESEG